ncbi:MAG: hypothetical protein J6V11_04605 [Alphaproteobacteria bacterium]|nr:hypothetical protein [Alphaproteobacteria bacterium]
MKLSPSQSGRSMVEMLGVLAIVGVLSIGGIMGYSYAMDKYRANTTVNDIMLRATDLLAQANQGHTELSLTEWEKEDTIYPISNADYANDGTVMLDAGLESNPIPKRVCEMIFNDIFPHTVQIDTNAIRGISGEACDENNIMTFYFDPTGAGPAVCEPACSDGEVCDNGACFKNEKVQNMQVTSGGSCSTDADCQIGYTGTNCSYCHSTRKVCLERGKSLGADCTLSDGTPGMCTYFGRCEAKGCNNTDKPCPEKNQYCASPNTNAYEAFPNGEMGSCVTPKINRYEFEGRVYYMSQNVLTWWDAKAFCDMLGLDFVPRDKLFTYEGKDANGNSILKRTKLNTTLRELSGAGAVFGPEYSPAVGYVFVLDHTATESIWMKNGYSMTGAALCW